MSILGAIVAGLGGTVIFTLVMNVAPQMSMPKMDIVGMLGSMFSPQGNRAVGWAIHLMMGVVFAIIYALLWNAGLGAVGLLWGALLVAAHWLVAGTMMGSMSVMHDGVKAGTVEARGVFMLNNGGTMAFIGGLIGHVVFGLVVALVYGLFV